MLLLSSSCLVAAEPAAQWRLTVTQPNEMAQWLEPKAQAVHQQLAQLPQFGLPAVSLGALEMLSARGKRSLLGMIPQTRQISIAWQAHRGQGRWSLGLQADDQIIDTFWERTAALVPALQGVQAQGRFVIGDWEGRRDMGALRMQQQGLARQPLRWSQSEQGFARLHGVVTAKSLPVAAQFDVACVVTPESVLSLNGQLAVNSAGLEPIHELPTDQLPAQQQGLLVMGLSGDGSLSPLASRLLGQISQHFGRLPVQQDQWKDLSGPLVMTWRFENNQPILSIGLRHEDAVGSLLQVFAAGELADALVVASRQSAQPLVQSNGRIWWLRQADKGLYWLSPDQRFLAQLQLGVLGQRAAFEPIDAEAFCSLQIATNHLAVQAQNLVAHDAPARRQGRRASPAQALRRLGQLIFPALGLRDGVSHLQLRADSSGKSTTVVSWTQPEGPLFSLWWMVQMQRVAQQMKQYEQRSAQLRDVFMSWRQGRGAAGSDLERAVVLPWPVDKGHLQVIAVDYPLATDSFGALSLFSDGSIVWIDQAGPIYQRAQQLERILSTGYVPRNPWGALKVQIEGAYNLHHTGDATVSPF